MQKQKEVRDFFPDIEQWRTVEEFINWFEKGLALLRQNSSEVAVEVLLRKLDSQRQNTAKRVMEEVYALYNLLFDRKQEFIGCQVRNVLGSQSYDVELKGHPKYKYIEIVSSCDGEKDAIERKQMLSPDWESPLVVLESPQFCITSIVCQIENALKKKLGKNCYTNEYALLVVFDAERVLIPPYQNELKRQLAAKSWPFGVFQDVFIVGTAANEKTYKLKNP